MKESIKNTLLSMKVLLIITGSILVIALVLIIIVGGINSNEIKKEKQRQEIINSAKIPHGVTINNIDVSGLNYNEAVLKLQKTAEAEINNNIGFVLTYNGKQYKIDSDSFVITFNTEDLVMQALGMVKDSGYLELKTYMDAVAQEGVNYEISYNIDTQFLKERAINAIYDEIYVAPQNATAVIKEGFTPSYSSAISRSPFEFKSDVDGLEVDVDALINTIIEKVNARDFSNIEITTKPVKADITLDDIEANTVRLAYFKTEFHSSSSDRSFNVNLAAERLNETCVAPGDTFSMEGTIGRRVGEPWKKAPAVVSDGAAHENQYGGGVCQVATTLYNAVVKSDLEIVYRRNHSIPSSYVDEGLDATINTDTIDFRWRNNTDYNVYVFSWTTSSKDLYCVVYGQAFPDKFDRIEFRSTFIGKIEPTETEYIKVRSLKEGEWFRQKPITGLKYDSFAYYYKGSQRVDTKEISQSTYKMHPERIYVWSDYSKGDYLDPMKEMGYNEDTKTYYRKYKPVPTPSPIIVDPTPTPDVTETPNP